MNSNNLTSARRTVLPAKAYRDYRIDILSDRVDAMRKPGGEKDTLASIFVRGKYVSGCNHSEYRPRLYHDLGLWRGTINIQLPAETDERFLIPKERIPGRDAIDSAQDFLIRPCKLKGIDGYQILPIDKATGDPRGHHSSKTIEISLTEKIDLRPDEEIEVELRGFDEVPV